MGESLVSICMPCHNAGRYVAAALDSVLAQTYPNIEIIVVSDGSTDNSAEVLEGYRSRGVKVVHQENKGQCAAANRAFAESRGEYIEFFARVLCGANEVLFCPDATLYYRSGMPNSLSARKSRSARESECESVLLGTAHILKRRQDFTARSGKICMTRSRAAAGPVVSDVAGIAKECPGRCVQIMPVVAVE